MNTTKRLSVGDLAPNFHTTDQDGTSISLDQFLGQKVVLYFYPKDDTPGCTLQACNLRDHHTELLEAGYTVLGISTDDELSHRKFKEKYGLPFTLLVDPHKEINNKYGVWVEKEKEGLKYWGTARTTFVIDAHGYITRIIQEVNTENHTQQILG